MDGRVPREKKPVLGVKVSAEQIPGVCPAIPVDCFVC